MVLRLRGSHICTSRSACTAPDSHQLIETSDIPMILPVKGAQDVSFASLISFVFAKTPILKNLFCAGEAVGSLDCGSTVKKASLRDSTPCPSRVLYKEVIGALARPKSRATNPRTGAATSDVPINGVWRRAAGRRRRRWPQAHWLS